MQAAAQRRRLTYDDFLLFPDDGLRHEIIDGEHYVTPSPHLRHQELVGRLHFEIELYLRRHSGGGWIVPDGIAAGRSCARRACHATPAGLLAAPRRSVR